MPERAIFLDRDNTLIDDPGYINHPDQVRLLEGVAEALIGFRRMGYKLVVASNQSGVARGIVTEAVLAEIHARMEHLLAEKGASVDRIYYCPFHVDGVIEKYRTPSESRKPNPGMLLEAARDMDLDLQASWCIGDKLSDVEAGQRAGCRTILIDLMSPVGNLKPGQIRPDYIAVNMREALNIVKKEQRAPQPQTVPPPQPAEKGPEPQVQPQAEGEAAPPAAPEPAALAVTQPTAKAEPVAVKDAKPQAAPPPDAERLLQSILDQLKAMHREDLFDEFSFVRLMAGIAQIAVVFCLLAAVWFLMTPERNYPSIYTVLGFAVVLQVMSLTFYMQGRK